MNLCQILATLLTRIANHVDCTTLQSSSCDANLDPMGFGPFDQPAPEDYYLLAAGFFVE